MNKFISGLTAFENSPILNVAKEQGTKALVAGSVLLGFTLLTTGIVPVNVTINGNEVSNVEEADAKVYNPAAHSFLPCRNVDPVCYVAFDVAWTWIPSNALRICRDKYLYTDHVRRSFPPHRFACMRRASNRERYGNVY